jgi:hypothetical protein
MMKLKPFNQAQIEHFCIKIAVPKANQHQHLSLPACSSYSDCIAVKGNNDVSKV